jgi:putative ABC transport system substrate-binding protein
VSALSRRRFLGGSLALAGLGLVSGCSRLSTQARPPEVRRIGFLQGNDGLDETQFGPFRNGLRALGWVEGEKLVIEMRFARNEPARSPALIAELEAARVELIVCSGMAVVLIVKQANLPIPAVAWAPSSDPISAGLVQNIARPEGNITGVIGPTGVQSAGKRLQILQGAVPGVRRVGVMAPADWPNLDMAFRNLHAAGSQLGLQLCPDMENVQNPSGIEPAISALKGAGADALVYIPGTMFITNDARTRIAEVALAYGLPSMSEDTTFARVGGLLAYSPDRTDAAHRLAWYVDQILKGAKPADLPMQGPSKFDFVINVDTAKALGLIIPEAVLAQATEIIQ